MSPTRAGPFVLFGNATTAGYPEGGGHWSVRLQYMFGCRELGVRWRWLELLHSSGVPERDGYNVQTFLRRMTHYGFGDHVAVALLPGGEPMDLRSAQVFGPAAQIVQSWVEDADVLWNFCFSVKNPLLSQFRKRALLDLDPGHVHVASLSTPMSIADHQLHFTVGSKLADSDTLCPTVGHRWIPFFPLVSFGMWKVRPDPGQDAPFSSVTQWTWGGELPWQGRLLSTSKRDAYLRFLALPKQVVPPFELAVNLAADDNTGDRELLRANQWRLAHPHAVGRTPALYRRYIQRCRAEFSCPKPVFRELKTGWFSDRSAAFLASGRPVLAEDTGFSDHIPTGRGLLKFSTMDEAIAGVEDITANYPAHMKAARELAAEYFDSTKTLRMMLAYC